MIIRDCLHTLERLREDIYDLIHYVSKSNHFLSSINDQLKSLPNVSNDECPSNERPAFSTRALAGIKENSNDNDGIKKHTVNFTFEILEEKEFKDVMMYDYIWNGEEYLYRKFSDKIALRVLPGAINGTIGVIPATTIYHDGYLKEEFERFEGCIDYSIFLPHTTVKVVNLSQVTAK